MTTTRQPGTGMRPFGALTSYREARRIALDLAPRREGRAVPLGAATGRVLTSAIRSEVTVPAGDRAAMDGYALHAAAAAGAASPWVLDVVGRALAGDPLDTVIEDGTCLEIATGAPLPPGADAVVPVEKTRRDGDRVSILSPATAGDHVSKRGEDIATGDPVAAAGDTVGPGLIGALASMGVATVEVVDSPRVLLIPTGNELVPPGQALQQGQVYDSNSVAIRALLETSGAVVERSDIVADDRSALEAALRRPDFDLVITLGGSSVGRHDLVLDVIEELGDVLVHGVAIKPGKPVLLGEIGGRPAVGLPGFPTSCLMTGYLFAEPMVRAMAGLRVEHRLRQDARLAEAVGSPGGKRQFLTVTVDDGLATPAFRSSSTMTSMSGADGWIEIAEEVTELIAATSVSVTFF